MYTDDAIAAREKQHNTPGDPELLAFSALERLYTAKGQWREVIGVLEEKVEKLESVKQRQRVWMQIAGVWCERLQDTAAAIATYRRLLEEDPSCTPAAGALEQLYREAGEWQALTALLIACAETAADVEGRIDYLMRAARVLDSELQDPTGAFWVVNEAFTLDPAHPRVGGELDEFAGKADCWLDLVHTITHAAEQDGDDAQRSALWIRVGRLYRYQLNDWEHAEEACQRALELNRNSVSPLHELRDLYRASDQPSSLAHVLRRLSRLEKRADDQLAAWMELAKIQQQELKDRVGALRSYACVLEISPSHEEAWTATARLHESAGEWPELIHLLNARAEAGGSPQQASLQYRRMAEVQEKRLVDADAAIASYARATAIDPTDRIARAEMVRIYLSRGDLDAAMTVLEAELAAISSSTEQANLCGRVAGILVADHGDRVRASDVLERAIVLAPRHDASYRQLEDLYIESEDWAALAETYLNHAEMSGEIGVRLSRLRLLADLFVERLDDPWRARDVYQNIVNETPTDPQALSALAQTHEKLEDWDAAADVYTKLVDCVDASEKCAIHVQLGRLHQGQRDDRVEAKTCYRSALAEAPSHLPALEELVALDEESGEWEDAVSVLERACEVEDNPRRGAHARAAGVLCQLHLADGERAGGLLRLAAEVDPNDLETARYLAQIESAAGNDSEAAALFARVLAEPDQLELGPDGLKDLFVEAAEGAARLKDPIRAIAHYRGAHELDPDDDDILLNLAELAYGQSAWDEAFRYFRILLARHQQDNPDDVAGIYERLSDIKRHQGDGAGAVEYAKEALTLVPGHAPSLRQLEVLQTEESDWSAVLDTKLALSDVGNDDERARQHRQIGSICRDELHDSTRAIVAYEQALALSPRDHAVMHQLLELHSELHHWPEAVAIIDRIVAVETDPARQIHYLQTGALLVRDMIGDPDAAIRRFETVLDADPLQLKAFEAIDTLLTAAKAWHRLEQAYRRMLSRISPGAPLKLRLTLWRNLAEIYRSRLSDYESAIAAYETLLGLAPDDRNARASLVELYDRLASESFEKYAEGAVRQHQDLVQRLPHSTNSFHALYDLYIRGGQADKAYCAASVLAFLRKASARESETFERYRRSELLEGRTSFSEAFVRRHIFHPELDPYVTAIFGVVAPALAHWLAHRLPTSLRDKQPIALSSNASRLAQTANYVRRMLCVPAPLLYVNTSEYRDFGVLSIKRRASARPVLVIDTEALRDRSRQHLAFALGRQLVGLYAPFHTYLLLERSADRMQELLLACLKLAGMPVKKRESRPVGVMARALASRLKPSQIAQLSELVRRFVVAGGAVDLHRWGRAAEFTCLRAGFVLCGDLDAAAQVISHERADPTCRLSKTDQIKELLRFAVCEDFFAARARLGVRQLAPGLVRQDGSVQQAPIDLAPYRTMGGGGRGLPRPGAYALGVGVREVSIQVREVAIGGDPSGLVARIKARTLQILRERYGQRAAQCSRETSAAIEAIVEELVHVHRRSDTHAHLTVAAPMHQLAVPGEADLAVDTASAADTPSDALADAPADAAPSPAESSPVGV
ncbi:MAG: tetratricopeptide repeat protein [Nannocystaceae bacterium]